MDKAKGCKIDRKRTIRVKHDNPQIKVLASVLKPIERGGLEYLELPEPCKRYHTQNLIQHHNGKEFRTP